MPARLPAFAARCAPGALSLLLAAALCGCTGGHSDEVSPGVTIDGLFSFDILVREGTTDVYLAQAKKTLELLVRGTFRDGSQKMIDPIQAEWTPTPGAAGEVSIRGLFTATRRGTAEIEARIGLLKDRITLTVYD